MLKVKNQAVRELWQRRLAAQLSSGLSITAWCVANKVSVSCFHDWRKRLPAAKATTLVPVRVMAPLDPIVTGMVLQMGPSRLTLPRDIEAQWLATLLKGLS
jgi:hypothetical protein